MSHAYAKLAYIVANLCGIYAEPQHAWAEYYAHRCQDSGVFAAMLTAVSLYCMQGSHVRGAVVLGAQCAGPGRTCSKCGGSSRRSCRGMRQLAGINPASGTVVALTRDVGCTAVYTLCQQLRPSRNAFSVSVLSAHALSSQWERALTGTKCDCPHAVGTHPTAH